jgi:hypothetical protein
MNIRTKYNIGNEVVFFHEIKGDIKGSTNVLVLGVIKEVEIHGSKAEVGEKFDVTYIVRSGGVLFLLKEDEISDNGRHYPALLFGELEEMNDKLDPDFKPDPAVEAAREFDKVLAS